MYTCIKLIEISSNLFVFLNIHDAIVIVQMMLSLIQLNKTFSFPFDRENYPSF